MSLNINHLTITNGQKLLTVKELLQVVQYEYNELYIDKFWENIENDKWIYIGDKMLEWLGYNTIRDRQAKEQYLKLITKNFVDQQDYVHLTATEAKKFYYTSGHDIETIADFNTHNKAKHLIVSPDCFKESLMLMETAKAKEIRRYYVQLEKIFKFYLQYQSKYQAKQLEEEKNKNTNLTANAIDYNQLQKREYLYIATNSRYASQNNFKIGKTQNLKQRLSAYNTSHNQKEPYYYAFVSEPTYYAKSIEYILKHILVKFRNSDSNEIYVLNYDFLEKIVKRVCTNYEDCVNYYNECISDEMKNMSDVANAPQDIWEDKPSTVDQEEDAPVIEYYGDCKDYSFVRFKAPDKSTNYQCTHCKHTSNRIDGLQSHFQRKNKCFDKAKNDRVAAIKANEKDPVIIYYRDDKKYGYFESYSNEKSCIEFNCTHCGYKSNNVVCIKRHFDRKTKCYDMEDRPTPVLDENTKIETLDGIEKHTYFRALGKDNLTILTCTHCEYQAPEPARMRRHFKRQAKCWTTSS